MVTRRQSFEWCPRERSLPPRGPPAVRPAGSRRGRCGRSAPGRGRPHAAATARRHASPGESSSSGPEIDQHRVVILGQSIQAGGDPHGVGQRGRASAVGSCSGSSARPSASDSMTTSSSGRPPGEHVFPADLRQAGPRWWPARAGQIGVDHGHAEPFGGELPGRAEHQRRDTLAARPAGEAQHLATVGNDLGHARRQRLQGLGPADRDPVADLRPRQGVDLQ